MKTNNIKIIFLMLMVAPLCALAENRQQYNTSLSGQQLQGVQAMGRAVLSAKHNRAEAPDLVEMRTLIEELRNFIKGFRVQRMQAVMVNQAALKKGPGQNSVIQIYSEDMGKLKDAKKKATRNLQASINSMRNKRMAVKQAIALSDISANAPLSKDKQRHQLLQATIKLEQLETELQSILSGPENKKMIELDKLQKRMALKPHDPVRPVNDTPTISTLAKHRDLPK